MKKIILTIACLIACSSASSENIDSEHKAPRKIKFGWDKSLEASMGYDNLTSYIGSGHDNNGVYHATGLFDCDLGLYGIYVGIGGATKDTGQNVYGYKETISTFEWHLGPTLRLAFDENNRIVFSPYIGWRNFTVNDTSGNAIGQKQDYGTRDSDTMFGIRVGYVHKFFMISGNVSTKDVGFKVGVSLDLSNVF